MLRLSRTCVAAAAKTGVQAKMWHSAGAPPAGGAPSGAQFEGQPTNEMGWDPEQEYGKAHPFYDPFYSNALFEFEFEEGFIDNAAFMQGNDADLANADGQKNN